jgi:DNA-binding LacI/PurR family transcriptional regulator
VGGGETVARPESASPPPSRPRAAPRFDVARVAGVSHQTVSRVINRLPGVAPATRERVELAIAELQFLPSPAARTLASRRSNTIGVIRVGRPDWGPSSAALGFSEAAGVAGYMVTQASMGSPEPASLRAAVRVMMSQNVEAIVVVAGERDAIDAIRQIDLRVPLVAVASEELEGIHRVSFDQYAAGRVAMDHLIGLGHESIAHISGPADSMDAGQRVRAWRDALAEAGLPAAPLLEGTWHSDSGYERGLELAASGVDAIFVGNDQMALGVLHAFRDKGISVPDDVSVMGFDDIPEAAHFLPPLTTMRQDFDSLGRDLMATVLDVLGDEKNAPDRTSLVPELVVRDSTRAR